MKEIISKNFNKLADLKSFPSPFHSDDGIAKEDGDFIGDNKKKRIRKRRKTKMLYQLNRPVDDVSINQIRE